jgi:hypothetical protein
MLSLPEIRVNRLLYGEKIMLVHGTYIPLCAIIIEMPIAFISELFPDAFIPYSSIPGLPLPNETSFAT